MRRICAGVLLLLVASPTDVQTQGVFDVTDDANQVVMAGLNMALAGLTAGIVSHIRGKSVLRGVLGGSAGGGVAYFGKRVAVDDFAGAGFLGREIGALGASISRSAAFGSGLLDTLVVPLGPVRAYLVLGDPASSALRLDAEELAWLAYAGTRDRFRFDFGRSLSAGSAVFTSYEGLRGGGDHARGLTVDGLIVLLEDEDAQMVSAFAHERAHVVQREFIKIYVGLPYEKWMGRYLGIRAPTLGRIFDLGLGHLPVWLLTNRFLENEARGLVPSS